MNIYDFTVKDQQGNPVSLKKYEAKVLLVVNTATQCGLTSQYTALQELYDKFQAQGFEILDFPCNQFLNQAPETDAEISQFCTLNFGTTFPRFAKLEVNGQNADPLYLWLKKEAPEDRGNKVTKAFETMVNKYILANASNDIKWNFCKFLIDKEGKVVARYSPAFSPENIEQDIISLLK